MKIWTCGSSPRSGSRNAWTRIKNVSGASRLSNFWNFFGAIQMISCNDWWWPWTKPGCITLTRRQSNIQWGGGIAAHSAPKNSECKNTPEKFLPRFFGIKTASPSLIFFQRAKLSTQNITDLCWCNRRTFWRKNASSRSPRSLVLARQCPGSPGTCNRKKLVYLGFQCLDHQLYSLDLAPSDYHLFPGLKKQLKGSGLQKSEQWTKKCIGLRGEYVEWRCSLFPSWSG